MSALPHDMNPHLVRKIVALSRPLVPEPTSATPALKSLPGIRAVLFDVYGTMLVSASGDIGAARGGRREEHLRVALNSADFSHFDPTTGSRGIELLDQFIDEAHEALRREGIKHPEVDMLEIWSRVIKGLLGRELIRGEMSEEIAASVAVDYESRVNPVWPMPRLRETIDALAGSGRKLGIVSNAQFYTPLTLSAFPQTGWNDGRFDDALCVWSYKLLEAKPSDRLVQTALQALKERDGIKPADVLCVGNDMLNDILPAVRTGCRTALFAGDGRSYRLREGEPRVAGIKPDLVVTDLLQLVEALV